MIFIALKDPKLVRDSTYVSSEMELLEPYEVYGDAVSNLQNGVFKILGEPSQYIYRDVWRRSNEVVLAFVNSSNVDLYQECKNKEGKGRYLFTLLEGVIKDE